MSGRVVLLRDHVTDHNSPRAMMMPKRAPATMWGSEAEFCELATDTLNETNTVNEYSFPQSTVPYLRLSSCSERSLYFTLTGPWMTLMLHRPRHIRTLSVDHHYQAHQHPFDTFRQNCPVGFVTNQEPPWWHVLVWFSIWPVSCTTDGWFLPPSLHWATPPRWRERRGFLRTTADVHGALGVHDRWFMPNRRRRCVKMVSKPSLNSVGLKVSRRYNGYVDTDPMTCSISTLGRRCQCCSEPRYKCRYKILLFNPSNNFLYLWYSLVEIPSHFSRLNI